MNVWSGILIGSIITCSTVLVAVYGTYLVLIHQERKQRTIERRRREDPVCGCRHHVSFHEDGEGECHHADSPTRRCGCQQYVGPPL